MKIMINIMDIQIEINKNEREFIEFLHSFQSEINQFIFNVAVAGDRDEEISCRLFSVYKFLKEGISNQPKKEAGS